MTVGPVPANRPIHVALVGNPNTGKTTLFNALTGLRHRVGNYPGVTVETKSGETAVGGTRLIITDLPGTYSFSPRSLDEMLAISLLVGLAPETPPPDVILAIVDASNLDRNLYLTSQVVELGVPVVLALNMIDVAAAQGLEVDPAALAQSLGVPVVAVQANTGRGLDELRAALVRQASDRLPPQGLPRPEFPAVFRAEVDQLAAGLLGVLPVAGQQSLAFLVERALLDPGGPCERALTAQAGGDLQQRLEAARGRIAQAGLALPDLEVAARYAWIRQRLVGVSRRVAEQRTSGSDRLDAVLLHPVAGSVIFVALMSFVFMSIFAWADPLIGYLEEGQGLIQERVGTLLPDGPIRSLVNDGIIAGVGGVLVFLPQIVILFGLLAILEDCGYMARAAFLMDKVMATVGLSGRGFIPMMSSFACAIPGVMATRTIPDSRERLLTILLAPLMSCSARLPVYTLLITAFFSESAWYVRGGLLLAFYSIGVLATPLAAWFIQRFLIGRHRGSFLLELPTYKRPSLYTVVERMVDRGWAFMKRAGTVILATSIVLWGLQYYPRSAETLAGFEARRTAAQEQLQAAAEAEKPAVAEQLAAIDAEEASTLQAESYLGRMGKLIEPAVRPLGWDWRIGMAAIASFPAREVVVGAMGTIFSVGTVEDADDPGLQAALRRATWPDGSPLFTLPVGLSLVVFFALCCQCAATLAVIRRETNTWKWPVFTFVYMTTLAYLAAMATYQIGVRLGG